MPAHIGNVEAALGVSPAPESTHAQASRHAGAAGAKPQLNLELGPVLSAASCWRARAVARSIRKAFS